MKYVVIGDLHCGVKDGNSNMMNYQLESLNNIVTYCKSNNIDNIILTGDIFEVRKSTNTNVLNRWKSDFFDVLRDNNINVITIIGNHDMYYHDKLSPNSISEHLSSYDNITIVDKPTEINGIHFVSWICKDNYDDTMEYIKNNSGVMVGHFEINGAVMVGTQKCTNGLQPTLFKNYDKVLSGHFHNKGAYGNITYVGTPYATNWGEYGIDKGFHVLDENGRLEFIKNDVDKFVKIIYNESIEFNKYQINDNYIKLVVDNIIDYKLYEKNLLKLEKMGSYDLKIIEPIVDRSEKLSKVDVVDGNIDTNEIMCKYIDDVYPEHSDKVKVIMLSILSEALEMK